MLGESATVVVAAGFVCALVALFIGCTSKDVDLGGTENMAEASSSLSYETDAETFANLCDPCTFGLNECPGGSSCGVLAADGNTYCFALCPSGNECGDDETCTPGVVSEMGVSSACIPNSGTCGTDPPLVIDGTMPEQCGPLTGPTAEANCNRCRSPEGCQQNGCYAGQWCDTRNGQCYDPPSTCP